MNKDFLISQLNNIENAKRVNRMRVANLVLENPELFPFLLQIIFEFKTKTAIKAAWILELVCAEKLDWLAPHLKYFIDDIYKATHDSCVRPISKICNFIAVAYTSKKDSLIKDSLTKNQVDLIIETGFDWMISNHKVATKAYTMNALFLLGKNLEWVHQELQLIIQKNIVDESPAYKARGRITLDLINKK
ncbi:adenylosuccinate lyase [Lutibacter sp.]|uniref:adenylosuccinate lyase n=1 Tax=Lutibacter sp. TaxID=1925666 RepID=UPI002735FD97|nr:adenylosuccinate lyase [Lutibacter sp.]MDP3312796.1 adenylosuccinate lyase [Lutibacter sp.]